MFTEEYSKQVFRDDFVDESNCLDPRVWKHELGNNNGWGNGEMQVYTDARENAFCKDGILHVQALKQQDTWTSARLISNFTFTVESRIDVRLRTARVDGPFPAVWALSARNNAPWPLCGEMDLFEMQTIWNYIPSSLHFQDHHADTALSYHDETLNVEEWHIYSLEWTYNYIAFYHDGTRVGRYDKPPYATPQNWPYDETNEFNLIINNAMSSFWGTNPSDNLTQHTLLVDWISVSAREEPSKTRKSSMFCTSGMETWILFSVVTIGLLCCVGRASRSVCRLQTSLLTRKTRDQHLPVPVHEPFTEEVGQEMEDESTLIELAETNVRRRNSLPETSS